MSRVGIRLLFCAAVVTGIAACAGTAAARPLPQTAPALDPLAPAASQAAQATSPSQLPTLVPNPLLGTLSPAILELLQLERDFSESVGKGGGKAFVSWFADDAITLNNGKPAVLGRTAIAATATWDSKEYHLSWYPEGAQMGPSGDTGFTWGHYDAATHDKDGKPLKLAGRYITFWKKVNGKWKVALDASAEDAPAAAASSADCCSLPKP